MTGFQITTLPIGAGTVGICAVPGRMGDYAGDLSTILRWQPGVVFTMITRTELERVGAGRFADDLAGAGVDWRHLPIEDFGAPGAETSTLWPEASSRARLVLESGGRVLAHCFGGCGRSGMALLRLMIETGEAPEEALLRLRGVRPCAVETAAQMDWATAAIPIPSG